MERAPSSGDAGEIGLSPARGEDAGHPAGGAADGPADEPSGRSRRPGTSRDVTLLWTSNAADALGTQMSGVAFPLLLLGLGHPPATVGLLAGAGMLVTLLCGPVVAVLADRGLRKPVMVGSAVVAAAAMGAVALSAAGGRPPFALLLGALLVERTATACYEAAARGTVALVSASKDLPRVVAGLEAGDRAALVAGPFLGGVLYQVARPLPFAADALSYAVTALCVRAMPSDLRAGPTAEDGSAEDGSAKDPTTPPPAGAGGGTAPGPLHALRSYGRETSAGFTLLRSAPRLRLVLLWTTTVNAAVSALYFSALLALEDGGGPLAMGVVLAVAGGAGLAGSLAAPAVVRRLGAVRTLVGVTWLTVPPAAGLAAADSSWGQGLCFGAFCLLLAPATVVVQAAAIADTPPALQARTGALMATAVVGAGALAAAVAGALPGYAGPAATPLACAAALALLALFTGLRADRLRTGGRP
ncbi:MFS transporter [Streptomyces bambusae]|uniref:MFS transporter n=1 Tax=Streptomyces bambusae TaxID=1550616 RepID=UPI001CFF0A7E|nr:MFS transporter [Streptomyces bambusae]MCB5168833.1 MFS transporter [Streptomyces bambusae]